MLKYVALWTCALVLPMTAEGSTIAYNVIVDTSSISGTNGSVDFNFNPGLATTQSASLYLTNFLSNGTLAGDCPCGIGDVAGQLPATLTFDNGESFNDYFDLFTFGSALSFQISLYGPAVSAPDGTSTSGSAFAFSMFSNSAGTIPTLTTNTIDGFAFVVNLGLDGTTTVTDYSAQVEITPATPVASSAPEPSGLALIVAGFIVFAIFGHRGSAVYSLASNNRIR